MVVGVGNIWRFPYLAYRNGGGAFFIPYLTMLFFVGMPMMIMEMGMGQYWQEGPITVWKISPLFKGIGISMTLCVFIGTVYYCLVTTWSIFYFISSLRTLLPWSCCEAEWAGRRCVSFVGDLPQCNHTPTTQGILWTNDSKFAADDYFHNHVLHISSGFHHIGALDWRLAGILFLAWSLVFLVLVKGVKSLGKFSYVTTLLPYIVLTALLVKMGMQDGAREGLLYFVTPNWARLADARVWNDAVSQIFFSSGVSLGICITLASYNRRGHNVVRDAIFLSLANSATSIYAGCVVFCILGFMAHSQGTTVDKVVTSGPGLTFIAYPQAVTLLSGSSVWSALFFLMLITLALSSMFANVETIITSVVDAFRGKLGERKFWVTLSVCLVSFILGLSMCTEGGIFVLTFLDTYTVAMTSVVIGLVRLLSIATIARPRRSQEVE